MKEILEFKHIIDFWPTCADFGRDISISPGTARAMRRRNSIPGEYWSSVIKAAAKRGFVKINLERLASVAARALNKTKTPNINKG